MTVDRRPLGPPVFSEPDADIPAQPAVGQRPPVDRAVFLAPPVPEQREELHPAPASGSSMVFSAPERQG